MNKRIDFKAINDQAKKLIDIDFSGVTSASEIEGIQGTLGFETDTGWKYYTGDHGLYDYVENYGIKLIIPQ